MLLAGKVVVVSGIGPGLGIELALLAAAEGATGVVIAARTPAKLDDAEAAIRERGLTTPVLKMPTDIADAEQCRRLVTAADDAFGRIDALVNSAYVPGRFEPIATADLDDWRRTFDVNVFGTMHLTQAVIPVMKRQGGGAIVMINSMVTRKPVPWQSGYAVSKSALTTATALLALELAPHGIRVNSAYMGWMWGPPVESYLREAAVRQGTTVEALAAEVAKNIPLGRIPDDAECAKAALFLVSDYASVVTGAALDVNGGEFLPR
ncbi:MAG: short-chain dehydrogenase [Polyangiaceae bacterium UTPRO1]|jgi:NAD(P)-dependent dehydrogenase (short-subunit alcohol dehydrogenase family)|nr:SDR family oxidoreductase [Myxococcales bacterium]OQY68083.1 MAG: short-chain dehydrogenase [Polyangiaceae bacterium UTPRO1]